MPIMTPAISNTNTTVRSTRPTAEKNPLTPLCFLGATSILSVYLLMSVFLMLFLLFVCEMN